jgi:UDP-glucose 4-epimerase
MADSFTYYRPGEAPAIPEGKLKVLVTGARGNIGSRFAEAMSDRYDLRLMCHSLNEAAEQLRAFGEVVEGDITDLQAMHELCRGIDTVIHLAGMPSPSTPWDKLLPVNIDGTYNVMVAAHAARCRRVVFASSIHAVSGYPVDRQVKAEDPVNPGDLYGVSKCFGEAMGRYMAEQHGLSVLAVRICWFQPVEATRDDDGIGMLDAYISPRDMNQLLSKCIDDRRLKFAILHGLSDNQFKRLDLAETRELLGYEPQDDLTDLNPKLASLNLGETMRQHDESGDGSESGIREDLDSLRPG